MFDWREREREALPVGMVFSCIYNDSMVVGASKYAVNGVALTADQIKQLRGFFGLWLFSKLFETRICIE